MTDDLAPGDQPAGEADDLLAQCRAESDRRRQRAAMLLRQACGRLAAVGVDHVRVAYDGYSDSGRVENITASIDEQPVEIDESIAQLLDEAACELLPSDWADDLGSSGTLLVNVSTRKLVWQHYWRVETTEYEEEEFTF